VVRSFLIVCVVRSIAKGQMGKSSHDSSLSHITDFIRFVCTAPHDDTVRGMSHTRHMHTYTHTYTHIHTYSHTHIKAHAHIHTHIHTYSHTHTYICVCNIYIYVPSSTRNSSEQSQPPCLHTHLSFVLLSHNIKFTFCPFYTHPSPHHIHTHTHTHTRTHARTRTHTHILPMFTPPGCQSSATAHIFQEPPIPTP